MLCIQRELAGYREALSEMADEARAGGDRSARSSEKSIHKAIQRLSARLLGCQRRLEDRKRLTQTMTFEDLGVDRTFVDLCRFRDYADWGGVEGRWLDSVRGRRCCDGRHNHTLSRNARSGSGARYRPADERCFVASGNAA